MKKLLIFLFLPVIFSCTRLAEDIPADYTFGGGAFIVNEGNFLAGNGSVSFYSYDSLKVFNDLFYNANSRPLGDVPNSMFINSGKAFIVVNNSGKIEVADANTLRSVGTINGLISPRNMAFINDYKAYVTSMYSDSLAIIDLNSNTISGYINIGCTSESITILGSRAYVSNWIGGDKILVLNTMNNQVTDTITVGREPENIVIDRFYNIWVLCTGGWNKQNPAELIMINSRTNAVEKRFPFPSVLNSPSCLQMDYFGQNLFFIDKGVWRMSVTDTELPSQPLIAETGAYFYRIALNPVNSDIFITDAADFTHNGNLLIYKNDGTLFAKHSAGIIPGAICFRISINPLSSQK
jgi:YVTN family beta-propeller protein